jgi:hypothetical protein
MNELESIINNTQGIRKLNSRSKTLLGRIKRALYPLKMVYLDYHKEKLRKKLHRRQMIAIREHMREINKNKYMKG